MTQNALNNQTVNADFTAQRTVASAGTTVFTAAVHTDVTNAGSSAQCVAQATAASGADAYHTSALASTRAWCHGIDASDSAALKETTFAGGSTSPSTGTLTRKVTTAGEQTMPLQPAFFAFLSATDSNVTGGGSGYVLGTGNVLTVTQQGTAMSTAGVFTAPVTGWYMFIATLFLDGILVAQTSGSFNFTHESVNQIDGNFVNPGVVQAAGSYVINYSTIKFMLAGEIMQVTAVISGGTDVTDVIGGGPGFTSFSGALIC